MVWLCVTFSFGEGRPPYVEVRKINSNESGETVESEPFICGSSDSENDLMDEGEPELIENGTFYNEFNYGASQNKGEDSGEEGMPLRLFVYGVISHHNIPNFTEDSMNAIF